MADVEEGGGGGGDSIATPEVIFLRFDLSNSLID